MFSALEADTFSVLLFYGRHAFIPLVVFSCISDNVLRNRYVKLVSLTCRLAFVSQIFSHVTGFVNPYNNILFHYREFSRSSCRSVFFLSQKGGGITLLKLCGSVSTKLGQAWRVVSYEKYALTEVSFAKVQVVY